MNKIEKSLGTHNGHFHADEVTACALLILFDLVKSDLIFRTREEDILKRCEYICDVGGEYNPDNKTFDHHQATYTGSLSSAGMILLYLKDKKIILPELYEFLNRFFVIGVDAFDTGKVELKIGSCFFSQVIETFVPLGEVDDIEMDKSFFEALSFTLNFLKRLLNRFYYFQEIKKIVKKHMETNKKFIIFDHALSWVESFFELGGKDHPALFIIMPIRNQWKLRAIPPSYEDRMNVRVPLPEEWAGLRGEKLKEVSGIKGAVFCHKGGFISIWETKEDALAALRYIFEKRGIKE
jgi:uncharacterized UPF0160 family protein